MLLAIDIGNTNIVVAVFAQDKITNQWRIFSDARRTGDEYFSILHSLFRDAAIDTKKITHSALSSVVPPLIGPFISATQQLTGKKPLLLSYKIYGKLPIHIPPTALHSIGSDLVCNAMAAWQRFKTACIIVDFGTALTFLALDTKANILGTAIAPGIGTALKALCSNTAQLPIIPLEAPPSVLGTNTVNSMQSGLMFGYKGLVESIIQNMKQEMQKTLCLEAQDIKVLATGGLNSVLKPLTSIFDVVDKYHTLKGLKIIADFMGKTISQPCNL